jgi:hypothetical protein
MTSTGIRLAVTICRADCESRSFNTIHGVLVDTQIEYGARTLFAPDVPRNSQEIHAESPNS